MHQTPNAILGAAGSVRLSDGRSITFSSAGPKWGFPVVYCHGAIGSPRWRTPGLDAVIDQLSIRYLVVNRPGFGGSDPSPGRSVAGFAQDIGEVTSALGYRRFSVVGVSAGAPYALACGWALAERVVALAAVSPLGPARGCGARGSLRYKAPLVPFGAPHAGPAVARVCLRAAQLHRRTSPQAIIEDYRVCRRHWGFEPTELRVPVMVWHGKADRLVPLAHALALANAIPTSSAHVDPKGGHFFYSRLMAEIVRPLVPLEPAAVPLAA